MTALQLSKCLAKHRQFGVAIDTNLLLLLWVGNFERSLIQRFKRTRKYTEADFDLLVALARQIRLLVTTPSILTEVSNLAGQLPEDTAEEFRSEMKRDIQQFDERHFPCKLVVQENTFIPLGLADSTLTLLARQKALVLTDDLPLYIQLAAAKLPVINFTHIRAAAYDWKARWFSS